MSQLTSLFDAFQRGEIGFEELATSLSAHLDDPSQDPGDMAEILAEGLATARDRGLAPEVQQALLARLGRPRDATISGTSRDWQPLRCRDL